MKSIRARLFAILLVGAMGITSTACGKEASESDSSTDSTSASDSSASDSDSSDSEETADEEMLKQDMTISDYEVEEDASVPVNQGASQNSTNATSNSNGEDDETSYVVVTDEAGATVTDDSGNVVTEAVTNSSNSSTTESDTYTASLAGKLLYWMDMSKQKDFTFNGDFIQVTFRVKDDAPDGNYTIGIGTCDFSNYDAETITYATADGDIAVGDAEQLEEGTPSDDGTIKIVAGTEKAEQGDEVTIHFTISDNPGIVGLIFRFTYDQNALEFVDYNIGDDCAAYIQLA